MYLQNSEFYTLYSLAQMGLVDLKFHRSKSSLTGMNSRRGALAARMSRAPQQLRLAHVGDTNLYLVAFEKDVFGQEIQAP